MIFEEYIKIKQKKIDIINLDLKNQNKIKYYTALEQYNKKMFSCSKFQNLFTFFTLFFSLLTIFCCFFSSPVFVGTSFAFVIICSLFSVAFYFDFKESLTGFNYCSRQHYNSKYKDKTKDKILSSEHLKEHLNIPKSKDLCYKELSKNKIKYDEEQNKLVELFSKINNEDIERFLNSDKCNSQNIHYIESFIEAKIEKNKKEFSTRKSSLLFKIDKLKKIENENEMIINE